MPIDPIEITDEVGEVGIRVIEAGEIITPEIQIEMNDISTSITDAIKAENPDARFEIRTNSSTNLPESIFSGNIAGQPTEAKFEVKRTDGTTIDATEAATDPEVSGEAYADAYASAAEAAAGLYTPDSVRSEIAQRQETNPEKSIRKAENRTAEDRVKYASDSDIKNAELAEAKGDIEDAKTEIENSKAVKDLQDKIDEMNKKLGGKDWKTFLEDAGAWSLKAFGLLIGGVLTYDLIKAYQNELKGCWQATSDGKTVSKIKITSLTCDSCCSDRGDIQPMPDAVCDPKNPAPGSTCKDSTGKACSCQTTPCSGSCCSCGMTCDPDEQQNAVLCSRWCSNSSRVLRNGNQTYSYSCQNPSLGDTVADIATNVDDIISNLIGGASGFLETLFKWGGYILLAVAAILLLYFGFKFISGLFGNHANNSSENNDTFHK